MVMNEALLVAVQAHVEGAVTDTVPGVGPLSPKVWPVGAIELRQMLPASCVTVTVWSAIDTLPERAAP
jgi:hypothetical protein